MSWQAALSPWNIGGGLCGLLLGSAILVSLIANHRRISASLGGMVQRLFSPVGFFGLVILVFLVISVLESGQFFDANITHHAVFGLLGYALALGFDLVSIVCMQARLNAARMRDEHGARLNLVGVGICAAVSAFANVAGSLQGYHPADLDHTPGWIQSCAPWTSMVFPLLIVVLSMTTDHILDHTPSRGIDLDAFRARERKRVEMLQIRLDTERDLLKLEAGLAPFRREREQTSGHMQHEWIFWRWLRPAVPASLVDEEALTKATDQAVQLALARLEDRVADLQRSLTMFTQEANDVRERLLALDLHVDTVHSGHRARLSAQSVRDHERVRLEEQSRPAQRFDGEKRTQGGERILTAMQHLGPSATDTQIARLAGCSRTSVARWRKRLTAQGQLVTQTNESQTPLPSTVPGAVGEDQGDNRPETMRDLATEEINRREE